MSIVKLTVAQLAIPSSGDPTLGNLGVGRLDGLTESFQKSGALVDPTWRGSYSVDAQEKDPHV